MPFGFVQRLERLMSDSKLQVFSLIVKKHISNDIINLVFELGF